ncbi:transcription factor IIF subunit tfg1 [Cladophialophora chaetospira]|uniref:Transcription factor IIF subunit tfg1 n=1 Tax=Cladophialophora chaetospira TaxID=386627 RepID=A0AA38XJ77_9EURO|nr:transcription factor IIF subunit tfg1 [Cladophialophora chaetospira]
MNPTANGGSANKPVIRRKKAADPFFKGPKAKPVAKYAPTGRANGHLTPPTLNGQPKPQTGAIQGRPRAPSPSRPTVPDRERVSGFTDPRVTAEGIPYKDFRLVTTKKDLLDGLRYHILQLADKKPLDIRNEVEFAKPARLHRRDPRAPAPGHLEKREEDQLDNKDGLNAAEREELNRRKEARQKEREANLAQIAPSQNAGKKLNFKKKTLQVYRPDFSAEEKRRIQTNYEEKLPWHLEDFDNRHCLVGQHQQGSRDSNAAFVYEPAVDASTGKFRLIPIEKVYQFKQKVENLQKMTIEEVEAAMKKGGSDPEWLVRSREARVQEQLKERAAKESKGLFSGASKSTAFAGRTGEEVDLDFEEDFADDEEGDLFIDKDEDQKIAEARIKEDQLQANFLDFKDLKEYDEADEREKREAEAKKKNFKGIRKALERRERNYNHGSDSEYDSTTETDEEEERLERERLANKQKDEEEARKSNLPSSGTNTPSGRKEKRDTDREDGGAKKSVSSRSLKRPASPNGSEASGTDASVRRKKVKSRHLSSTQPTPGHSRPGSPANVPSSSAPGTLDPSTAKARRRAGAGSPAGSDTDTDGAAMSDASRARRIRLNVGGSPPAPSSRAASPIPVPAAAPRIIAFPSEQDIRNAIPREGISVKQLLKVIPHPADRKAEFVSLVKAITRLDKEKGILFPK